MQINKKLSILSTVIVSALTACNGGGNSGPNNTTNYGEVVSISKQKLGGMPVPGLGTVSYASPLAVGYATGQPQLGYYFESNLTVLSYESANQTNTKTLYNYDVTENLIYKNLVGASMIESVSAYAIQYQTQGQNYQTDPAQIVRTASGLIIVPNMKNGAPIRGVVVYFHPTTFGKNQVPSCLGPFFTGAGNVSLNIPDYCNVTTLDNTGDGFYASLSAIYAARGFVVIAPDYVGQGADYNNVHPYVAYPDNNVYAAFNMFPALRQILASDYGVSASQELPLFITGYSEGGGYALKASQMAQGSQSGVLSKNALKLKITSPQEGAYSLADQMNFAFNDNNDGVFNCSSNSTYNCGNVDVMSSANSPLRTESVNQMNSWNIVTAVSAATYKPALTSYVLTAAMYYSFHNLTNAYNFAMNTQFWSDIPMSPTEIATLYELYSGVLGTTYTGGQISGAIVNNTFNINNYDPKTPLNLTFFLPDGSTYPVSAPANHYGTNNAGTAFINPAVSANDQFQLILTNGSTYNWTSNSPINFIHMVFDSAVTVLNTHEAYSCMKYGVNFAGGNGLVSSSGSCSVNASAGLIESTVIPNFQMTNNYTQLSPLGVEGITNPNEPNPLANSKFWTPNSLVSTLGTPFDHPDMFVIGNIIALCTFENSLQNGTNSGVCPSF